MSDLIKKANVLLIEDCDFDSYPHGGQLSFAKNMLKAFGNRLALVGVNTDSTPTGRWVERQIGSQRFCFFGIRTVDKSRNGKPLIPLRISYYLALKKYMKDIRNCGIKNVFAQGAEVVLALAGYDWQSICYRFPGVKNEIEFSRYKWARFFRKPYEYALFKSLRKAQVILASGDEKTIADFVSRSKGTLEKSKIIQFPTRVDMDIFSPQSQTTVRPQLGMKLEDKVVVSCGRVRQIKGWAFILQAFHIAFAKIPNMKLIFVGDGEDRHALTTMSQKLGIADKVQVTGVLSSLQVAQYLNAADLFVVGSHREGWSNAMLEALACGKPIVSTNVSGANQMIIHGQNGYVVTNRDPKEYADAMVKLLKLNGFSQISLNIASKYSVANLPKELGRLWRPLA